VRAALAEAQRSGKGALLKRVRLGDGKPRRTIDLHVIPFTSRAGEWSCQ
jgi:hypothetical protein